MAVIRGKTLCTCRSSLGEPSFGDAVVSYSGIASSIPFLNTSNFTLPVDLILAVLTKIASSDFLSTLSLRRTQEAPSE
ncbi:hypothetical protein Leryth_011441 [Lithospermum erythrorhizon]|nr:hypothetical protein Leryth_011441 [Lithospermum erythrorhizon]